MTPPPEPYQAGFARRWGALRDPRVRALAWLLDAPDLLDAEDPGWDGKIMTLPAVTPEVARWLCALDQDPSALDAALGPRVYTRLGLYAEKLMAFYFRTQGRLLAHGLQVRANRNDTVGEFDFLLDGGALHIEFATKFYLLRQLDPGTLDALVGPNLADSLGAKMRKIVERQLVLGQHPAAQAILAQPVERAQALVKGWLFYPRDGAGSVRPGIAPAHCRGWWCAIDEIAALPDCAYVILPKLQWLAPYRAAGAEAVLSRAGLHAALATQLHASASPVLVAALQQDVEVERGFIVPADWRAQALRL